MYLVGVRTFAPRNFTPGLLPPALKYRCHLPPGLLPPGLLTLGTFAPQDICLPQILVYYKIGHLPPGTFASRKCLCIIRWDICLPQILVCIL